MFEKMVFDYEEKGLRVVPITPNTKACQVSGWIDVDFTECANKYKGFGIGLSLGCADLVMLDLDFENKELAEKVEKFLEKYPSPIVRQGNPNRPPARFYQNSWQNGSVSHSNKNIGASVEIRASRPGQMSQVVLPPTIHPISRTPYKWIGEHNLLNFDLDNLPVFPIEAWEELKNIIGNSEAQVFEGDHVDLYQGEEGRCANNSHIKYGQMVRASVLDGKTIKEIVENLISYDEKNQKVMSFFLCKHGKNWPKKTIEENALWFVQDAYARAIKQGDVDGIGTNDFAVKISEIESRNNERRKYPKFRGIAQEMFKYIYENSPVPRSRLACSSVLSLMSITLANKIKFNGIYPNLYTLMIAPSGYGKDFPLKFVKRALIESGHKELIGQSQPASDSGVMKTLSEQKERIDVVDEASLLFGAISSGKNDYANKMSDVYASLFTSTGDFFEGKVTAANKKVIGACHSPYISILGAMTPAAASETLTTKLIETGLGARFLYFVDDEKKRGRMVGQRPDIPQNIRTFIKMWRKDTEGNQINIKSGFLGSQAKQSRFDCQEHLEKLYEEIETLKEQADPRIAPLLNRAFTVVCKLALIDACSQQFMTTDVIVRGDNLAWATEFFYVNFKETREFIMDSVSGSKHERDLNKVYEFIKSRKEKGASMSDMARNLRCFDSRQRKSLVDDLVESESLVVSVESTTGRPKSRFYSHKYVKKINKEKQ